MKHLSKALMLLIQVTFILATIPKAIAKEKNSDWDYADLLPQREKTEGDFCATCSQEKRGSLAKLTVEAEKIDVEAMKRHLERQKERQIRKISNQECPTIDSPDFDSEMSLDNFGGDFAGPSMGRPNFKVNESSKNSKSRGSRTKESSEQRQMMALDPEYMDDIQDAIEEKMAACKREAKNKKTNSRQATLGQQNINNPYAMTGNFNSSNPYASMGTYNMMNPYANMNSFSGMNSFANSNPFGGMNNFSGISNLGGMNNFPNMMTSYNSMNPFPSYSSYASMNPYQSMGTSPYTQSWMGMGTSPWTQSSMGLGSGTGLGMGTGYSLGMGMNTGMQMNPLATLGWR